MWPVRWRKTDRNENSADYLVKNSILKFDFLNESDFGEYACGSFNLFGVAEIRLIINEAGIFATKQSYKPSLKRKLTKGDGEKLKRRQRLKMGIELRKRRFRKRFELRKT